MASTRPGERLIDAPMRNESAAGRALVVDIISRGTEPSVKDRLWRGPDPFDIRDALRPAEGVSQSEHAEWLGGRSQEMRHLYEMGADIYGNHLIIPALPHEVQEERSEPRNTQLSYALDRITDRAKAAAFTDLIQKVAGQAASEHDKYEIAKHYYDQLEHAARGLRGERARQEARDRAVDGVLREMSELARVMEREETPAYDALAVKAPGETPEEFERRREAADEDRQYKQEMETERELEPEVGKMREILGADHDNLTAQALGHGHPTDVMISREEIKERLATSGIHSLGDYFAAAGIEREREIDEIMRADRHESLAHSAVGAELEPDLGERAGIEDHAEEHDVRGTQDREIEIQEERELAEEFDRADYDQREFDEVERDSAQRAGSLEVSSRTADITRERLRLPQSLSAEAAERLVGDRLPIIDALLETRAPLPEASGKEKDGREKAPDPKGRILGALRNEMYARDEKYHKDQVAKLVPGEGHQDFARAVTNLSRLLETAIAQEQRNVRVRLQNYAGPDEQPWREMESLRGLFQKRVDALRGEAREIRDGTAERGQDPGKNQRLKDIEGEPGKGIKGEAENYTEHLRRLDEKIRVERERIEAARQRVPERMGAHLETLKDLKQRVDARSANIRVPDLEAAAQSRLYVSLCNRGEGQDALRVPVASAKEYDMMTGLLQKAVRESGRFEREDAPDRPRLQAWMGKQGREIPPHSEVRADAFRFISGYVKERLGEPEVKALQRNDAFRDYLHQLNESRTPAELSRAAERILSENESRSASKNDGEHGRALNFKERQLLFLGRSPDHFTTEMRQLRLDWGLNRLERDAREVELLRGRGEMSATLRELVKELDSRKTSKAVREMRWHLVPGTDKGREAQGKPGIFSKYNSLAPHERNFFYDVSEGRAMRLDGKIQGPRKHGFAYDVKEKRLHELRATVPRLAAEERAKELELPRSSHAFNRYREAWREMERGLTIERGRERAAAQMIVERARELRADLLVAERAAALTGDREITPEQARRVLPEGERTAIEEQVRREPMPAASARERLGQEEIERIVERAQSREFNENQARALLTKDELREIRLEAQRLGWADLTPHQVLEEEQERTPAAGELRETLARAQRQQELARMGREARDTFIGDKLREAEGRLKAERGREAFATGFQERFREIAGAEAMKREPDRAVIRAATILNREAAGARDEAAGRLTDRAFIRQIGHHYSEKCREAYDAVRGASLAGEHSGRETGKQPRPARERAGSGEILHYPGPRLSLREEKEVGRLRREVKHAVQVREEFVRSKMAEVVDQRAEAAYNRTLHAQLKDSQAAKEGRPPSPADKTEALARASAAADNVQREHRSAPAEERQQFEREVISGLQERERERLALLDRRIEAASAAYERYIDERTPERGTPMPERELARNRAAQDMDRGAGREIPTPRADARTEKSPLDVRALAAQELAERDSLGGTDRETPLAHLSRETLELAALSREEVVRVEAALGRVAEDATRSGREAAHEMARAPLFKNDQERETFIDRTLDDLEERDASMLANLDRFTSRAAEGLYDSYRAIDEQRERIDYQREISSIERDGEHLLSHAVEARATQEEIARLHEIAALRHGPALERTRTLEGDRIDDAVRDEARDRTDDVIEPPSAIYNPDARPMERPDAKQPEPDRGRSEPDRSYAGDGGRDR